MQTVSLPYRCNRAFLDDCRRVYAAVVRTAYANAVDPGGVVLKQKPLRDLVKSRFAGGVLDAWALHCATLEGMELRKRVPDGRMVFGGRKNLERRSKGLIEPEDWKRARLRPMTVRRDKNCAGKPALPTWRGWAELHLHHAPGRAHQRQADGSSQRDAPSAGDDRQRR